MEVLMVVLRAAARKVPGALKAFKAHPNWPSVNPIGRRMDSMAEKKGFWRAFLDFFVLFSGISTASNLSRTRGTPVRSRGLFLFRKPEAPRTDAESGGR